MGRSLARPHRRRKSLARWATAAEPGGTRAGHGRWNYRVRLAEGNAAYLEWSAHSKDAMVGDGESGTDMYCEALGAAQPLQR
jgi:hypothetical protein